MHYALSVAINKYKSDYVFNLRGCESDQTKMNTYLRDRFGQNIDILQLKGEQATRSNIINGFRTHLSKATEGELALFFFTGHGSQERSPKEFLPYQGRDFHESLVCYDSRTDGIFDLADKELRLLVSEVAANGSEVVVILDCCHSGSATRDGQDMQARHTPASDETRPLGTFLDGANVEGLEPPHVLLAACDRHESAYEKGWGTPGGFFTEALIYVLAHTPSTLTYHDLILKVRSRILHEEKQQTPQLQPAYFNTFKNFLDPQSAVLPSLSYRLDFREESWRIDMGSLQGMLTTPGSIAQFMIYNTQASQVPLCFAETVKVYLDYSELKLLGNPQILKEDGDYIAYPCFLPISPMRVLWSGESKYFKSLFQASQNLYHHYLKWVSATELEGRPSHACPLYEIKVSPEGTQLLFRDTQQSILGEAIPHNLQLESSGKKVPATLALMKHIDSFERIYHLKNTQRLSRRITQEQKLLEIGFHSDQYECKSKDDIIDITLYFDESTAQIDFELTATRPTNGPLYYHLLYLSRSFEIVQLFAEEVRPLDIAHNEVIVLEDALSMPSLEEEPGLNQLSDVFQLIITTQPTYYFNPQQPSIYQLYDWIKQGQIPPRRDMAGSAKNRDTWFVKTIRVKCLRQLGRVSEQPLRLADGKLTIQGHPHFRAGVGLASDAYHLRIPASDLMIRQNMEKTRGELIDFSTDGKRETILEFFQVENVESLNEEPLEICLDVELGNKEQIWVFMVEEDKVVVELGLIKDGVLELKVVSEERIWKMGFMRRRQVDFGIFIETIHSE